MATTRLIISQTVAFETRQNYSITTHFYFVLLFPLLISITLYFVSGWKNGQKASSLIAIFLILFVTIVAGGRVRGTCWTVGRTSRTVCW